MTKRNTLILIVVTLLAGIGLGALFFGQGESTESSHSHPADQGVWTCSMHPQIRQDEPGKCPICGMDLVKLEADVEIDNQSVTLSENAMKLANVQTTVVGAGSTGLDLRLNGKVMADERRIFTQSAHIPGRVEKLMVNFTGEFVSKGQTIAHIHSPSVITAQEELLEAYKGRANQPLLYEAAVEKLRHWNITNAQIEKIINNGTVTEELPIYAEVSGFVTNKMIKRGDYVEDGTGLYEVADLSKVWVLFEVYENQLGLIGKGDKINYTLQALPGKTFEGNISFIDPVINPATRVTYARIEQSNKDLLLKPEMFATGILDAPARANDIIVIPKSAVLWTGKRSVVYIRDARAQGPAFQMREVTLGQAYDTGYEVISGLENGEEIVVNGTFSVDAAAQLSGKPSMMSPETGNSLKVNDHQHQMLNDEQKNKLIPLYDHYLALSEALTQDDYSKASKEYMELKQVLTNFAPDSFEGVQYMPEMIAAVTEISDISDIEALRKIFLNISNYLISLSREYLPYQQTIFVQFCPMADEYRGGSWISLREEILNPYFGASMLTCGETEEILKVE